MPCIRGKAREKGLIIPHMKRRSLKERTPQLCTCACKGSEVWEKRTNKNHILHRRRIKREKNKEKENSRNCVVLKRRHRKERTQKYYILQTKKEAGGKEDNTHHVLNKSESRRERKTNQPQNPEHMSKQERRSTTVTRSCIRGKSEAKEHNICHGSFFWYLTKNLQAVSSNFLWLEHKKKIQ